jgi:hypothetical protein
MVLRLVGRPGVNPASPIRRVEKDRRVRPIITTDPNDRVAFDFRPLATNR